LKSETRYTAVVPSNIALIKYWGKKDGHRQLPSNDSISMTLATSTTQTTTQIIDSGSFQIFYDNHQLFESDPFAKKIFAHLKVLAKELNFKSKLSIKTKNSFPSSCGIASSASGMGALTLSSVAAWSDSHSLKDLEERGFYLEKLAKLARLGSGSACRSFWGGMVHWQTGESENLQLVKQLHPNTHWDLSDIIVIVSKKSKSLPSSQGHLSAQSSSLFRPRVASIPSRIADIKLALEEKDFHSLGRIIEQDSNEMHAVMMSSSPAINYYQKETIDFLEWFKFHRFKHNTPAYTTLDAGPNIHVICESKNANSIKEQIRDQFPNYEILLDHIGTGPTLYTETKEIS